MPRRANIQRPHRTVSAGDLRTSVTALTASTRATLGGGIERTLTPAFTVFVMERSVPFGSHQFDGVNISETPTHLFTLRHRDDVTAQMILERGGERFEILKIENVDGRGRFITLQCRELGDNDKEATKA